jgi:hypothetical protein
LPHIQRNMKCLWLTLRSNVECYGSPYCPHDLKQISQGLTNLYLMVLYVYQDAEFDAENQQRRFVFHDTTYMEGSTRLAMHTGRAQQKGTVTCIMKEPIMVRCDIIHDVTFEAQFRLMPFLRIFVDGVRCKVYRRRYFAKDAPLPGHFQLCRSWMSLKGVAWLSSHYTEHSFLQLATEQAERHQRMCCALPICLPVLHLLIASYIHTWGSLDEDPSCGQLLFNFQSL